MYTYFLGALSSLSEVIPSYSGLDEAHPQVESIQELMSTEVSKFFFFYG